MKLQPCDAWRYIGVPRIKCQHCGSWYVEDTSQHPEFCGDGCYREFLDTDPPTVPWEYEDARS